MHEIKNLRMAAALLSMSPLLTMAAPPDAGQLLNERQRVETPMGRPAAEPKAESAVNAPVGGQGLTALVQRVRFTGADGLASENELQAWVADRVGQRLNHAQMQALAARVTARLQAKGYLLARAYLPKQDLSGGELQIAVVAGRLQEGAGRLGLTGGNPALQARLRAIADANLPEGPVRAEDLERALLLMRDVPGVAVRSALEKGDQPGTSRIEAKVEEQPNWGASASLDNFANRYTGDVRATVRGVLNRPLEREDQAFVSLSKTRDTSQAAASYAWALSPKGLRANVNASYMRYSVGLELEPLELRGTARSLGGGLSFPLQRSRERNVWLNLDAEERRLDDESLGVSLHRRRVDRMSAGFSANAWDELLGGGQTDWGAAVASGEVSLARNADDAAADAAGASTQGGFTKLNWHVARNQSLPALGSWTLFVAANGQLATDNLDSSEKFQLGGPAGVRAYAVGEASGDSGWLASMELRRDFRVYGLRAQGLGFVDVGGITQHQTPWNGALADPSTNHYRLAGAGLGFNLSGERWSVRSAWAHTIGNNPGRSSTGLDADGRAERQRAWVQLNVAY
ncbi:Hemolysin activation/secretion protein [Roseateles sp. YR242]|uniref:ShlB/FhaC/HecB family hemolysin secretion/activation protein n=1 Tax=Roseateles sp. YR242 TaxID=1855305 RepID=UPI0008C3216E|nr:ShlB/FhaC/HecB family hemolysin secretion/activation protein [Roseateles sp. YR242]SEL53455.1 Hemolysin activation/secretion protein [Roseateles sp. YR242]